MEIPSVPKRTPNFMEVQTASTARSLDHDEWNVAELFRELIEPIASFLDVSSVGRLLSSCERLANVKAVQRVWRVVAEQNFNCDTSGVCILSFGYGFEF